VHGKLPWGRLFAPAFRLAEGGFPVSARLNELLALERAASLSAEARAYFLDGAGKPWPVGHKLANPAYAATLRRIAEQGAEAFYAGPVAEAIVAAVRGAQRLPGDMTLADLAGYQVKSRPPLCFAYRGMRLCSMGPPSSGGPALGHALMLLDGFDLGRTAAAAMTPAAVHLAGEALRLAYEDRNWYVADADFVAQPSGLLDPAYIAERRLLIHPERTRARTYPGLPPGAVRLSQGADATIEAAGTTHLSVVDGAGNAVSMTSTIEAGFGSGLFAGGFLLNNQMTDFSFRARDAAGRLIANRVQGGKRPRSSMAPTLVFDGNGTLRIVAGSPGGSRIIPYVLKSLVALIDWRLDAQTAVDLPNFASTSALLEIEAPRLGWTSLFTRRREGWRAATLATGLAPLGRSVLFAEMTSGSHVIIRRGDGRLEGGADRRREGAARGE
jgi:gamma-glutamyltranspeptidase/glutathione hydrolase